jgi:hypothetical protein
MLLEQHVLKQKQTMSKLRIFFIDFSCRFKINIANLIDIYYHFESEIAISSHTATQHTLPDKDILE